VTLPLTAEWRQQETRRENVERGGIIKQKKNLTKNEMKREGD
jgi:hypothetical protein